ncbi:hypothetical protein J7E62_13770 [Variovorax paradoxus]|nr:hypothetical protein [Variovorax paradoxus]
MNTERDNFHDWARDKPDTSFGPLAQRDLDEASDHRAVCWGRLAVLAVLGAALVAGFKWFAGL